MSDIVKWLRSPKPWHKYTPSQIADEIERLRARIEEAEWILRAIKVWGEDFDGQWGLLDDVDAFLAGDKP